MKMYRGLKMCRGLSALLGMALAVWLGVNANAGDKELPKREMPKGLKAIKTDVKDKKPFSDDAYKWVYFTCKKEKAGSWDLGKGGVEHVQFGTNAWVVHLAPDGESPDYYWAKEKLSSGVVYHWAFTKSSDTNGDYAILFSTDGFNYYLWDDKGFRLSRVAP